MGWTSPERQGWTTLAVVLAGTLALPGSVQARQVEGSFERSLAVSGGADVEVQTGSGSIDVRPGSDGRVVISARIEARDRTLRGLSAEERIRRIEANPPIEQAGNSIRIGHLADDALREGVSISYTLTVPATTNLRSRTGSGSQHIEGLTGRVEAHTGSGGLTLRNLTGALRASTGSGSITAATTGSFHASTGSGSIRATGVSGPATARTGSGVIDITQTGSGDVEVSSGSGSIRLQGVRGSLRATTGSGGITAQGAVSGEWRLSAASGGISVSLPPGQGFELDADTSSGRIEMGMPVTVSGTIGRRALRGSVGGGGPLLHVRTASGGIRIRTGEA